MKTIKITDEQYEFLKNLRNEISTQDSLFTNSPYYFEVNEDMKVPTSEDYNNDGFEYRSRDDGEIYSYEDIKTMFYEDGYFYQSNINIEHYINKHFNIVYYKNVNRCVNVFLTRKAAERYIEQDKHNLNNPKIFIKYAKKNYELEELLKIILSSEKRSWMDMVFKKKK